MKIMDVEHGKSTNIGQSHYFSKYIASGKDLLRLQYTSSLADDMKFLAR